MGYTEDSLVAQPAIQLFAELGWETLVASEEVMGAIPCPFCGQQENLYVKTKYSGKLNAKGQVAVECIHCGAIGAHYSWGYAHDAAQTEDDAGI